MSGITEADVFAAAEAIEERGDDPTNARVRAELGRGSSTTITRHMKAWRDQQAAADPQALPDIPESVREPFAELWRVACDEARELARDELAELRKQLQERCDVAVKHSRNAQDRLVEANEDRTLLRERLRHAEQARDDAKDAATRLRAELDSVNSDFSRYQSQSQAKLSKAESQAERAREAQQQARQTADARHKELRERFDQADAQHEAELEQARRQLSEQRESTRQTQQEIARLREQLAETTSKLEHAQQDTAALHKQIDEGKQARQQQREDHENAAQDWRVALELARAQADDLRKALATTRSQTDDPD